MYKKIILITLSFFLFGCASNINQMTIREIIDDSIKEEKSLPLHAIFNEKNNLITICQEFCSSIQEVLSVW